MYVALDLNAGGTSTFGGNIKVKSTTSSTSTSTGALVVSGGVGVGGSMYVASNTFLSGDVKVSSILDVCGNLTVTGNVIVSDNFTVAGTSTSTSFNATSDYRLKENIESINDKADNYVVDNLRPVSYTFVKTGEPHIGFLAHELQSFFPTAVTGTKDGDTMQTVNYSELIPILVKEIQQLKKEVAELKTR